MLEHEAAAGLVFRGISALDRAGRSPDAYRSSEQFGNPLEYASGRVNIDQDEIWGKDDRLPVTAERFHQEIMLIASGLQIYSPAQMSYRGSFEAEIAHACFSL